jgi:hypothetical protein
MKLTRRDAVAALGAAGVGAAGSTMLLTESEESDAADDGASPTPDDGDEGPPALSDHDVETLVAVAAAIYPSAVENVETFVTEYVRGRVDDDPERAAEIGETVSYLDDYVETWYDVDAFVSLSPANRTDAFDRMNADTAEPDPDGGSVQRVRYYLVNDLLFALYASPTGGELAGVENPQGHPGGTTSYRRGPDSEN